MKTYESSAKTIEEAISAGLEKLGVSISDVTIDVLEEGSKGLFGLFGSRQAKVRLTLKETEADPLEALTAAKPARSAAPAKPAAPKAPEAPKPVKPAAPKTEAPKAAPVKPTAPKAEAPKAEAPKAEASKAKPAPRKEAPKPAKTDAPKAEAPKAKPTPKAPVQPIEKPVVTMIPADQVVEDSAPGRALAFLRELTHLMGVEVSIEVGTDAEGNVFANMTGDTLGILIGRRGETLDALQYLTSLKVNRGQEGYTRVTLDTENYRAKREEALTRLANRMANRAIKTGRKVSLEPMNPYERRILHSALQANDQVDTHSEGEEPQPPRCHYAEKVKSFAGEERFSIEKRSPPHPPFEEIFFGGTEASGGRGRFSERSASTPDPSTPEERWGIGLTLPSDLRAPASWARFPVFGVMVTAADRAAATCRRLLG